VVSEGTKLVFEGTNLVFEGTKLVFEGTKLVFEGTKSGSDPEKLRRSAPGSGHASAQRQGQAFALRFRSRESKVWPQVIRMKTPQ
jgi:hypothetical protein